MESTGGKVLIDPSFILRYLELKKGLKVADFGCGATGYFIESVSKNIGEDGVLYAIDVQKNILESVKSLCLQKGIKNVKLVWTDLEIYGAAKLKSGSLDRGMLVNVLFQTQKQIEVLKEVNRLLKIGGRLVIVDWKEGSSSVGPPTKLRVSKKKLEEMAAILNMSKTKEFDPGPYHYGYVYERRF